jgi:lipopolysaccharide transport system permease protein
MEGKWDLIIKPRKTLLSFDVAELWRYRDLITLFVRRDFVSQFKQTILGPLWFFIQPIFTTIIFTVVFGKVANISTDGIPQPLFYMAGILIWNYFADCLMKSSETFRSNQHLFGKVYFPRLIVPISIVISNLLRFGVQLLLFVALYLYYLVNSEMVVSWWILAFPALVVLVAMQGLAFGLIVSSMTTKYRDLKFLVQFGVQLAMYASPVVYPVSMIPEDKRWLILLNPVSSFIEFFRFSVFGEGYITMFGITWSIVCSVVFLAIGMLVFNKVEKSFIDTV